MGNDNILVIGIAGGSARGKTTLMKNLIADCEDEVTVLSHDNYYKRHDELTMEERSRLNYDEPDAFDTSLMVYHLDHLRHGHAVECPVYDFSVHKAHFAEIFPSVRKKVGKYVSIYSQTPIVPDPHRAWCDPYYLCRYEHYAR